MAIRIFDRYGKEQSWEWLQREYGPVVIHPAERGWGWRVAEIYENADPVQVKREHGLGPFADATLAPAVICVHLTDAEGGPAANTKVAWYWPDAPSDPRCGPANGVPDGMVAGRAIFGTSNLNGDVGFAMGAGAYYWPPDERGPHAVWAYGSGTNSDVMWGLGMRAATNHDSLWPVYEWCLDEEPEPPVEPDEHWETLFKKLDRIIKLLEGQPG